MAKNRIIETLDTNAIRKTISDWEESKTVAEFFKKKLGRNGNAGRVVDNIIEKSLAEEKPEWTKLLLDSVKSGDEKTPAQTQINFFTNASEQISENLQKIIDVTPQQTTGEHIVIKTGIEGII